MRGCLELPAAPTEREAEAKPEPWTKAPERKTKTNPGPEAPPGEAKANAKPATEAGAEKLL